MVVGRITWGAGGSGGGSGCVTGLSGITSGVRDVGVWLRDDDEYFVPHADNKTVNVSTSGSE